MPSDADAAPVPTAPAPDAAAAVIIEIDRAIPAHTLHGRRHWLIRGRVVAPAPAEEAALLSEGRVVARIEFGREQNRGNRTLPDGRHESVFHLHLSLPAEERPPGLAFRIAARTRDGAQAEAAFACAVRSAEVAEVTEGAVHPMGGDEAGRPPVVMQVERAERDREGRLVVVGWAVGFSPLLAVEVRAEGIRPAAAQINLPREDVAKVLPLYPGAAKAGFRLALPPQLGPGIGEVTVQAVTRGGFSHELVTDLVRVERLPEAEPSTQAAASTPQRQVPRPEPPAKPDPRRKLHFYCDFAALSEAGELWVEGWAVCAAGLAGIAVELDGRKLGEAELGRPRPDVGEQFPGVPFARLAGYKFKETVADLGEGLHTLRLVARNGLGDTHEESRPVGIGAAQAPDIASAGPPGGEEAEFRFQLDHPSEVAGIVAAPVTGRMTIEGWAVARSGIAAIEIALDGKRLGNALTGLARQDVGAAYPDWPNSLRSGYAFHCPERALQDGEHEVELIVRAGNGRTLVRRFRVTVKKAEIEQQSGIRRHITAAEAELGREVLARKRHAPRFQLVMPVPPVPDPKPIAVTLRALAGQAYDDWRLLVLTPGRDAATRVKNVVAEEPEEVAARIVVASARGRAGFDPGADFIGALTPGDELGADALLETAIETALHPDSELVYADEQRPSPVTGEADLFCKPDFSPDLLLSANYIGRPWFASAALLRRAKLTPQALARLGEHDALLRLSEAASAIRHIPRILAQTGARAEQELALGQAALERAAERRGIAAEILPGCVPGTWRFRRTAPVTGKVSIIIPTCAAKGHIKTCIESLRAKTAYRDFEIVCIDNIPDTEPGWKEWLRENADEVVVIPGAFNWSRFNNTAAAASRGEYLLFLNDDVEVIEPGWLDALLEHAARPEVAAAGPLLLYPDRKVQHAGMFLAEMGIGRHPFRFAAEDEPGYFGLGLTQRNVIAVTGACMLVRRATFDALGRFDETHDVINNDLDFCLRAHAAGKLVVFTPYAKLIHHELASRERLPESYDRSEFLSRWRQAFIAGDPYFSPLLVRGADDFRPDYEPVQPVFAGHLFRADETRRILVIKVDHIGDFVTAIPAIRRLKRSFPKARIHVLASPASRLLGEAEPSIDEIIEFQFFNARSELGQIGLDEAALEALRARLARYRFDLAIDLRKHYDTRHLLRLSGARVLAGYDHAGRFPWLDVAPEWEDDRDLQRKRRHVGQDMIALVDAVVTASDGAHTRFDFAAGITKRGLSALPEAVRALFEKPVVAIHPAAGALTKQWPPAHFAALIDGLIAAADVNALLVGGPGDAEAGAQVLAASANPARIGNAIGQVKLGDLPGVFAACALYVGNDSGPKHIAAASGVPTIGIHSGTVDAAEWAPLGRAAVALRRNMNCSPCYKIKAEDCPRAMECLRGLEPNAVQPWAERLLVLSRAAE